MAIQAQQNEATRDGGSESLSKLSSRMSQLGFEDFGSVSKNDINKQETAVHHVRRHGPVASTPGQSIQPYIVRRVYYPVKLLEK